MKTGLSTIFEIQNLTPAHGLFGVWAFIENHGDEDSPLSIACEPLLFVGVAKGEVKQGPHWVDDGTYIVGVCLDGTGEFHICEEASNYYGVVQSDATKEQLLGMIPKELRERVTEIDLPSVDADTNTNFTGKTAIVSTGHEETVSRQKD